jgi:hypothetical protein
MKTVLDLAGWDVASNPPQQKKNRCPSTLVGGWVQSDYGKNA